MSKDLHDYYHNHLHHGKKTDKWELYIQAYDVMLAPYRDKKINLVEIGIQNGGSLEVWEKYFPNFERIVGCDINTDCLKLTYANPDIHVVVGDANEDAIISEIISKTNNRIDIVIDDGSHTSSDIITTFIKYFPLLADDGIFIIEDLHCSYWKEFEGGLYDPMSSMAFLKKLSDVINYEHWGYPGKKSSDLFSEFGEFLNIDVTKVPYDTIHSITFYNSVCIIHKKNKNCLGRRIIVGETQDVVCLDEVLLESHPPVQGDNYWTGMNRSPEAEFYSNNLLIDKLKGEIAIQKKNLHEIENINLELQHEVEAKNNYINEIINSKSWKLIQKMRNFFKGTR